MAIVTGAGRGISRGIALEFAKEGAKVVVASRTTASVEQVAHTVNALGGQTLGVTCDVASEEQVQAMVKRTVEEFGTVDILVNNAPSFGHPSNPAAVAKAPLEEYSVEVWDYVFQTGVRAAFHSMKAVFPHMKDSGGKVINFGSINGQLGAVFGAGYNANKEAIRALSRTAAREWGKFNINVNIINPMVATETAKEFMDANPGRQEQTLQDVPMGRFGTIEDASRLAVFLASEDSNFLTGMTFMLTGGRGMWA